MAQFFKNSLFLKSIFATFVVSGMGTFLLTRNGIISLAIATISTVAHAISISILQQQFQDAYLSVSDHRDQLIDENSHLRASIQAASRVAETAQPLLSHEHFTASSELTQTIAELNLKHSQLAAVKAELAALEKQASQAQIENQEFQEEIDHKIQQIIDLDHQISTIDQQISDLKFEAEKQIANLKALQEHYHQQEEWYELLSYIPDPPPSIRDIASKVADTLKKQGHDYPKGSLKFAERLAQIDAVEEIVASHFEDTAFQRVKRVDEEGTVYLLWSGLINSRSAKSEECR